MEFVNENINLKEIVEMMLSEVLKENQLSHKEWYSLKEAAKYLGVSINTLAKFREKGLKVCEIEGVKRVSKSEMDRFMNENSF
ncbi:helix-turn-helix domain-containing protein [Lysinibacillus sp. NPDC098008]|uniref:helix-turn-helix domain-containing protein n=1 Tax=Lysinibacillus sp. NPDC098008 TaxID=3364146 RepID=UPI0037F51B89